MRKTPPLLSFLPVLLLFLPVRPEAGQFKTRNVFIVVMDGPRHMETFGDPARRHIPVTDRLAGEGVLFDRFLNGGPTKTNPGHAAMTTGVYGPLDNSGREIPEKPSIFQIWLKETGLPADKAWVVAAKDKLAILADTRDPAWRGKYAPSTDCGVGGGGVGAGYRSDGETWEALMKVLDAHHPRLVLVNFREPDSSGHAGDWEAYLRGLRETDRLIGALWGRLQADPFYRDATALFVTNDHGRHLDGHEDGFVSHGDGCEGCRRIFLLALGPDFRKNTVVPGPRSLVDIPATAARLLGIAMPGIEGEVMTELFETAP